MLINKNISPQPTIDFKDPEQVVQAFHVLEQLIDSGEILDTANFSTLKHLTNVVDACNSLIYAQGTYTFSSDLSGSNPTVYDEFKSTLLDFLRKFKEGNHLIKDVPISLDLNKRTVFIPAENIVDYSIFGNIDIHKANGNISIYATRNDGGITITLSSTKDPGSDDVGSFNGVVYILMKEPAYV